MPNDVCVLGDELFVSSGHCITVFSLAGQYLRHWGCEGSGDGQFQYPHGVHAVGGYIYVADTRNGRVQVFTRAGEFISKFGCEGLSKGEETRPGYFYLPCGLCSVGGRLYVSDWSGRIQVFE